MEEVAEASHSTENDDSYSSKCQHGRVLKHSSSAQALK
jgi:hypothetical protein